MERSSSPRFRRTFAFVLFGLFGTLAIGAVAMPNIELSWPWTRPDAAEEVARARALLDASFTAAPALDRLSADGAMAALDRAAHEDPSAVPASLRDHAAALRALQVGDLPRARATIASWAARDGEDADTHLLRAEIAFRVTDLQRALGHVEASLAQRPNEPRALALAIRVRLAEESGSDLAGTRAWARRLVELEPESGVAYALLGDVEERAEEFVAAEAAFAEALRLNTRLEARYCDLGRVRRVVGDLEGALAAFARAIEVAPENACGHLGSGMARTELGQAEAAVSDVLRARALAPEDPRPHLALGDLFRAAGRLDEAAASYEEALVLDSSSVVAQIRAANLAVARGELDSARRGFARAIELSPDSSQAYNGLGVAEMHLGHLDAARTALERAAALAPRDPFPRLNLGLVAERQGDREAAREAFQAALDRDPNSEVAIDRLLALSTAS